MNSYFYCRTQYENLGDLIINKMLIDELCMYGTVYINSKTVPHSFISPLLINPKVIDLFKTYNFINEEDISIFKLLCFLKKNRVRISTSSPGPVFDGRRGTLRFRTMTFLLHWAFSLFEVKRSYIGVCCSNLAFDQKKFYANNEISYYYLRSKESVNYLKKYISADRVKYIPDLCFLLKYQVKPAPKKKIAIFDIRISDENEIDILKWCTKIAHEFSKQNFVVIVYYQVERDFVAAEKLLSAIKCANPSFRKNIVWYDDMDFYADKMFVVSNRLHSLLIGAAYDVYPICLFQESVQTLKLRDVINSSFSTQLPILFEDGNLPVGDFIEFYNKYKGALKKEYAYNAELCRRVVREIVEKNK